MSHNQDLLELTCQMAELGDLVKFYELQYNTLISRTERLFLPKVQLLSDVYKDATGETLDQKTFNDLINNGLTNVRAKHVELINKDLSKFKSNSLVELSIKELDARLNKLNETLQAVHVEMNNRPYLLAGFPDLEWSDIEVSKGEPGLNYDAIKSRYELRLTTEKQVEFYNLMLEVKASHERLVSFLETTNYPLSTLPVIGDQGCMQEAYDGTLSIVAESIENI